MRHKLDYIENICNEADIICLTETHLDKNITNDGNSIEGYCMRIEVKMTYRSAV
jgi:hypothetical protein